MIERARWYVGERGKGKLVVFAADDARCLPEHVPEPVGFVLLANTFHGVPDKTGLAREVREVREVLVSGGRFVVVNWHPMPREDTRVLGQPRGPATKMRLSPEDAQASVEPAGFVLEKIVDLPPYHYGAIFACG